MSERPSMKVPTLSPIDRAFPAHALDWMPAWQDIPEEFRQGTTKWNEIVHAWFFHGLSENVEFYPRKGIDAEAAFNAVAATLNSYAPKHQHKEAACAYMLSLWFKKISNWKKP